MKRKILWLTLIICAPILLFAQNDRWTVEDIINTEYVYSPTFSPDNQKIVWQKREGNKEKDRFITHLYLTRLDLPKGDSFRTFKLTQGEESNYGAVFSPDSESIYFLSSRDKGKKLWQLSLYGGEAQEIKEFENGISDLQWINEHTLGFVSNDGETLAMQEAEENKDNTVVVEDSINWKTNRVYAFDTKTKEVRRLTDNNYPISDYKVSKDGNWMVATLTLSRHYASDANPDPQVRLYNLKDGSSQEILKNLQNPNNFQFTDDHQGFYYCTVASSDPEWNGSGISELYYFDLNNKQSSKVDLQWEWAMEGNYRVMGNHAVVELANGPLMKNALYTKSGNSWKKTDLKFDKREDHIQVMRVGKGGKKLLYLHSRSDYLPRYYVADASISGTKINLSNEKEWVKLNAKLKAKPKAKYEVLRWKGYNGEEVTGLLYYPENYEEGKQYPLMLSIHGGPSSVDRDRWAERWSTYPNILSQRGMFVLKPNYHGSSHHGRAFVESIKENYYEPEMEDITKAIDLLQQKQMIDPDRLGTMGWSNGAIITTMLTVRYPNKFKVACPGAGDVNWTSDFGTCRFGVSFDQSYFGGAPWDNTGGKPYNENYLLKSPLFEMEKVRTPTIIFHGSEDRAVPRDQGWEYYRALQQIGQAPVRFLWFPNQPHGLRKITHQRRKMNEELAWIDKFLLKKPEENKAFKEKGSPLATLIKLSKVAHQEGLFGEKRGSNLIPEVVELKEDSLSIGRFEVTNAQYHAFDPRFYYPPQEANHPAMVDFEQAEAYIRWLNLQTNRGGYRLPTSEEADRLHQKAHKVALKENVLNYWAGYDLLAEQAQELRKKMIDAKISLLKPAGTFSPLKIGKAEIYDLGGNVAEFDDQGRLYGYGANDCVDSYSPKRLEKASFKGFRVVKD